MSVKSTLAGVAVLAGVVGAVIYFRKPILQAIGMGVSSLGNTIATGFQGSFSNLFPNLNLGGSTGGIQTGGSTQPGGSLQNFLQQMVF